MRVLAIDPGFERVGVAILEKNAGKPETLIYSACFITDKVLPFEDRLLLIGKEILRVVDEYAPDALAIETLFFNTNQKTALRVSEARGVIIYTAKSRGLQICEYTPLQIKIAVTGYGKAPKTQVADMAEKLISIPKKPRYDDEIDAIAIGLTCLASEKSA